LTPFLIPFIEAKSGTGELYIIVQEDYVGQFRPTEYRQIKMALMIKESTMLIIGYGLGDVNVLTALDWPPPRPGKR